MPLFSLRTAILSLPLLIGACWVEPSSDKACTLIGCNSGFEISFQASQWQTGNYQVELVADGRTILCSVSLPLPKTITANVCDAEDVQLGLSGSELPVSQQSLSEVRFLNTLPKQVQVTVRRDSNVLAQQVFTPTYQINQPNGPSCGPTCTYASAVLAW